MKNMKNYIYAVFLSGAFIFYACSGGINIFSQSEDVELGKQLSGEITADPKEYPVYKDPTVKNYINQRIFQHILTSANVEGEDVYPFQMEVIDHPDELNAFALPGGYIYVYTGLLKYLDSEAALAGVLGHEIAHAARRHATKRMTAYYGVSILASFLLGENPNQLAEIAANLFTGLGFLANSRADENESDEYSFKYLQSTRYYPGGVKFFFEKMRDEGLVSSKSSKVETFLSTHPDPIARIANTESRLKSANMAVRDWKDTGQGIYKSEYQDNIKGKIK